MELNYRQYSEEGKPLIVLHGLFGSQSNWGGHCKELANHFAVYGVDLRNHGESPHSEDMNYSVMADDVIELMEKLDIAPCSFVAHSMGGKVAMQLALSRPDLVDRLVIVDIAPVDYPTKNNEHIHIIDAMEALDLATLASRTEAEEKLAASIPEEATRKFIVTNLARNDEGVFYWRLNLAAIKQHYDELRIKPVAEKPFDRPVLFVKGAESSYIHAKNEAEILALFPQARVKIIQEAGHWVHADKPKTFRKIAIDFLTSETP